MNQKKKHRRALNRAKRRELMRSYLVRLRLYGAPPHIVEQYKGYPNLGAVARAVARFEREFLTQQEQR